MSLDMDFTADNFSSNAYILVRSRMQDCLNAVMRRKDKLFKIKRVDLFKVFLDNLPEETRQYYNCHSCATFFNRYGGLVTIDDRGSLHSALWDFEEPVPEPFTKSIKACKDVVEQGRVHHPFVTSCSVLGSPVTGEWSHFSASLDRGYFCRSRKEASDKIAEYLEDFKMLSRALEDFTPDVVNKVKLLLSSESLYRGDLCKNIANWFSEVQSSFDKKDVRNVHSMQNFIWKAVASAPTGYCHIRSSLIGTLLKDAKAGLEISDIKARYESKVRADRYMRPVSAPTFNAREIAEKKVAELGVAESFRRRYARFDELPEEEFLWKPVSKVGEKGGGIFSNVKVKEDEKETVLKLPKTKMTWKKFSETVLPTAEKIEVMPADPTRFMALVTAEVADSKNILKWDNSFSWYYPTGVDGAFKQRVEDAGGRYEDNEIRCSLLWNNRSDLDIHCEFSQGHIYYGRKQVGLGYLDVDMNVNGETTTPVENIRWSSNAPDGHYRFFVNNFRDRANGDNPFIVELQVGNEVHTSEGFVGYTDESVEVFSFDYNNKQISNLKISCRAVSTEPGWNVPTNSFVEVTGIITSPNTWKTSEFSGQQHIFFILKDCKDVSGNTGGGLFIEFMCSELREHRKTLEAYLNEEPVYGMNEADACGVGYNKDSEWNLVVRVTDALSSRLIEIDRFD